MFKKFLLIVLLLFSFNIKAYADDGCTSWYNFWDSEQECRDEASKNYTEKTDEQIQDESNKLRVQDVAGFMTDLDKSKYDDEWYRDATPEEIAVYKAKLEQERDVNRVDITKNNIDYSSNKEVLSQNNENLSIWKNENGALNTKVLKNNILQKNIDKKQEEIDYLKEQNEDLGLGHNDEKIKKLELEIENSKDLQHDFTDDEKEKLAEKQALEQKIKDDESIVDDGGVLKTDTQKAADKQAQDDKNKEQDSLNKANEAANNPGLNRLGSSEEATSIKNALLGLTEGENNIVKIESDGGLTVLGSLFTWIKDTLTGLIALIAVGVFLFIGIRLGLARGNPEEFKKGMMQLVYAVIGIFIVSMAWAAVILVSGLNL